MRLSSTQRTILLNLEAGRGARLESGQRPQARTLAALVRKGCMTKDGYITPAGVDAIGKRMRAQ